MGFNCLKARAISKYITSLTLTLLIVLTLEKHLAGYKS